MSKERYKVGDTFPATVRIKDVDITEELPIRLEVVELAEELEHSFEVEELDMAFDPTYAERARLAKIQELKEHLAILEAPAVKNQAH